MPTINGTEAADVLTGTNESDTISGLGGDDTIDGRGGNDTIQGGTGNDSINGGLGDDTIYGGADDDTITDGAGADRLYGEGGNDYFSISLTGGGRLQAYGGAGNDTFYIANGGGPNQAVTIDAGIGNDLVTMHGFATGNIVNMGDGDDRFEWGSGSDTTLTLGAGADRVSLLNNFSGTETSIITDYQPGIDTFSFEGNGHNYLASALQNWDGSTNPFGSGHLRLVQSGTDTLLQVDSNGGGDSYVTLVVFQNTSANTFTAADFGGYPPDGSPPVGQTINGTEDSEELTGTLGGDTISGLGGDDTIDGRGGNDTIQGGTGNDSINGGLGDDTIYGGADDDTITDGAGADRLYGEGGNDYFSISLTGGGRLQAYGGAGNDTFYIANGGGPNQAVTIDAGIGNDLVTMHGFATGNIVNMGDGDDRFEWGSGSDTTLTLGAGADRVSLLNNFSGTETSIITDYQPGIDTFSFEGNGHNYLASALQNWDGSTNPFGSGHLRLVQSGTDTLLQVDSNGGGDSYVTLVVFQNTSANTFTAADFGGYPPDGSPPVGQTINGTEDSEELTGTLGGDTISGLGGDDTIDGRGGNDTIQGGTGNDSINGGLGDDTIYGGADDDTITDGAGADRLYGEGGNDYFSISLTGGGRLQAYGGAGNDTFYIANGGGPNQAVTIDAGIGNDLVTMHGFATGNIVNMGDGDDRFEWGSGSDTTLTLGAGADRVSLLNNFSGTETSIITDYQPGIDTFSFEGNGHNYLASALQNWDGSTNPFTTGHLRLVEAGSDTLLQIDFDGGSDSYQTLIVFQNVGPSAFTAADFDGYMPTIYVEPGLSLTGTSGDDILIGAANNDLISGLAGNDVLHGNEGNDLLNGGTGADSMRGDLGNDTYHVDDVGDEVIENAGEGSDTIVSSITFSLGSHVENLTLAGNARINATGNALANQLIGNFGDNTLDGGAGADIMRGGAGNDSYVVDNAGDTVIEIAGQGTDAIFSSISYVLGSHLENLTLSGTSAINATGNGLNNRLVGNSGDNVLNGGAGADTMRGGLGDDRYHVDNGDDLAIENAGEGIDTVFSSVNYRLRANVENLTLTGTAVRAYGNSDSNRLVGNDSNNILDGLAGADVMRGGAGNDTYYVDNTGDNVIENASQGNDAVYSSVNYSLTSNVETLYLTGTTAVRAFGNAGDNRLVGNDVNNILNGGLGADVMRGGLGNDTYYVDNVGDNVIEEAGAGRDRIYTEISFALGANQEDLFARGVSAIDLTGNSLDNVLRGNSAANVLAGRSGADDLSGGGGADRFVFDDGDFGGLTPSTCDRIVDFTRSDGDLIDLSAVDANSALSGDQAFTFIGTGGFTNVAGQLRYEQINGNTYVYGDTDGDGVADFMLRLDGTYALNSGDFVI